MPEANSNKTKIKLMAERLVQSVPYAKGIQRSFIGGKFYREWRRILWIAENLSVARFDSNIADQIDFDAITTIHAHETVQAILLHNELVARGRRSRIKLMLTSHCPELPGTERAAAYRSAGLVGLLSDRVEKAHIQADEYAFAIADMAIFPSPESMDPYLSASTSISATLKAKEVRFVLTGVRSKEAANMPVPPALKECGDKFIICFIGRHNSIKGYDLLKDAAKILLERYPDIAIVVAGVPGPVEPLSHPRWIECGWMSNPEQLIAASDVFVLPNRSTFFDLVLLEAMSIGTPIIASRTGGNVTVAAMSKGVRLFDGLNGFVCEIEKMKSLSGMERASLAEANRRTYRGNFSVEHFASNYLEAVGAISATV